MSQNLNEDFEHLLSDHGLNMIHIIDMYLDSHVLTLSERDVTIANVFYEGVVKSVGKITRSQRVDGGIETFQTVPVTIANASRRIQDLLRFQELINRRITIRQLDTRISDPLSKTGQVIDSLEGVIDGYSWNGNDFIFTVADTARKIYTDLPKYVIDSTTWPNAIDVGFAYPIVGGLVEKAPIRLVDSVSFKYLACLIPSGHTIRSDKGDGTFTVYYFDTQTGTPGSSSGGVWTVVDPSNYSVSKTTDSNGVGVFLIVFTSDMSGFQLSVDIEGIEDTSPSTYTSSAGSLITNHADFVRFLFQNSDCLNIPSRDINIPSFLSARRDLDTKFTYPPTVSYWLGEQNNAEIIIGDLSLAMRRSMPQIDSSIALKRYDGSWSYGDGTFTYGGGSNIRLIINTPTRTSPPYVFNVDDSKVVGDISFERYNIAHLRNDITVNAGRNHSEGKFTISSNKPSAVSQSRYLVTKAYTFNCLSISNQNELDELASNLRDDEKFLPIIVRFKLNASGMALKKNDLISITTDKGIGKSTMQYDGTWSYGDGTFVYGKESITGWYKKKAEIIAISKDLSNLDVTAKIL